MVDHYTFFLLFELLIFINPSVSFSMALDNLSRRMHGWYVFWNHRFVRICFNSLFRCTFLELHHFLSTFCNFVILISTSKEKFEARLIFFYICMNHWCVCLLLFFYAWMFVRLYSCNSKILTGCIQVWVCLDNNRPFHLYPLEVFQWMSIFIYYSLNY